MTMIIMVIKTDSDNHEMEPPFLMSNSPGYNQRYISDDLEYHDDWEHDEYEDEGFIIKSRLQDMLLL